VSVKDLSADEFDRIVSALRARGYRVTPQRLSVAKEILGNSEHMSADSVYLRVKEENPTISLATVYTTLEVLETAGLVTSLVTSMGKKVYDPKTSAHINLVCTKCGRIEDAFMDSAEFADIERKAASKTYTDLKKSVTVYGVCGNHSVSTTPIVDSSLLLPRRKSLVDKGSQNNSSRDRV
jgi:Fur family peroxide stress response transcriptional regulator